MTDTTLEGAKSSRITCINAWLKMTGYVRDETVSPTSHLPPGAAVAAIRSSCELVKPWIAVASKPPTLPGGCDWWRRWNRHGGVAGFGAATQCKTHAAAPAALFDLFRTWGRA